MQYNEVAGVKVTKCQDHQVISSKEYISIESSGFTNGYCGWWLLLSSIWKSKEEGRIRWALERY
jgi:hypothetical protein